MRHFAEVATLPVTMKGHLDLVTEADKSVEKHILEGLRRLFPNDGVLGEEGARLDAHSGRLWVVDPIDGTANFVRGNDQWAVSIGLFADGRPQFGVLYAPVRDQLFRGGLQERGTMNGTALGAPVPFDTSRSQIGLSLHPAVSVTRRLTVVRPIIDTLKLDFRSCGSAALSTASAWSTPSIGPISLSRNRFALLAAPKNSSPQWRLSRAPRGVSYGCLR